MLSSRRIAYVLRHTTRKVGILWERIYL